jgi:hypothetical protein
MPTTIPRRAPGVLEEDLGEEIVLLAADGDAVHVLNETAAEVWRLVDGARDAASIAAAFAASYPEVDAGEIAGDARAVLADLAAKGLTVS